MQAMSCREMGRCSAKISTSDLLQWQFLLSVWPSLPHFCAISKNQELVMKSQTSSLPDLCLLIKQRDVTRLREALEAHPVLIQQQRWVDR